jgi:hypothetical protein
MKPKRAKVKNLVKLILLIVIIFVAVWFILSTILPFGYMAYAAKDVKKRKINLLYETDHLQLKSVCVKLLDEAKKGKWEFGVRYTIRRNPVSGIENMPALILQLKPTCVYIEREVVMIEFAGGLTHFGVMYIGEEAKDTVMWPGDKKLVDGLWYYDDGYQKNPDYEEYIESLKPKSSTSERPPPEPKK